MLALRVSKHRHLIDYTFAHAERKGDISWEFAHIGRYERKREFKHSQYSEIDFYNYQNHHEGCIETQVEDILHIQLLHYGVSCNMSSMLNSH